MVIWQGSRRDLVHAGRRSLSAVAAATGVSERSGKGDEVEWLRQDLVRIELLLELASA